MSKASLRWIRVRNILGAAITVVFAAARALRADTYVWNGATGNFTDPDWTDLSNPAVHTPPTTADNASFPTGTVTFSNNTTANASVSGPTTFNLAGNYTQTSAINVSGPLNLLGSGTLSGVSLHETVGPITVNSSSVSISSSAFLDGDLSASGGGSQNFGQFLVGNFAATNNGVTFTGVTVHTGTSGFDVIGSAAGATSNVIADNSAWTATGGMKIGLDGTGSLTIQNSATLQNSATAAGPDLFLGGYIDPDTTVHAGTGSFTVTGAASVLTDSKGIVSAVAGDGTFNVQSGAHATTPSVLVAQTGPSVGRVNLIGAGSQLTVSGAIEIGRLGSGQMIVDGGATVSSASGALATMVDNTFTSGGTVMVDNPGSLWAIAGTLDLAQAGNGIAIIDNTASITVGGQTILADQATANATLVVQNTGVNPGPSTFAYTGDFHAGEFGTSSFQVSTGSLVKPGAGGSGNMLLAVHAGSGSTVTVDGAGSLIQASNFYVGGTSSSVGGIAQVAVTTDGVIQVKNTVHLWAGSTIDVSGGGGPAGGVVVGNGSATSGLLTVTSGGDLIGAGNVIGNVLSTGGAINPGDGIGTLPITGNFQENSGGLVDMQIAGTAPGNFDQLAVSADLNIGGEVLVDFQNNFLPVAGNTFELFTDGTTSNFNPNTQFAGAAPGLQYQWIQVPGGWDLKFLNNASPVPEPASLLLPTGAVVLLRRRSRKVAVAQG
ncbi:MAG: hypothetical protein M3O30_07365 [Planctomycetota bacterium]|nr:hypothetical protein [Planctomycetota bacterium]